MGGGAWETRRIIKVRRSNGSNCNRRLADGSAHRHAWLQTKAVSDGDAAWGHPPGEEAEGATMHGICAETLETLMNDAAGPTHYSVSNDCT